MYKPLFPTLKVVWADIIRPRETLFLQRKGHVQSDDNVEEEMVIWYRSKGQSNSTTAQLICSV
jgi:hypothetical protein